MADRPALGIPHLERERYLADAVGELTVSGAAGDDPSGWRLLGDLLGQARDVCGFSKREAAQVAGFSEGTWRQLEQGFRLSYGQEIPPNPSDDKLYAAAVTVRLNPELALGIVGRELPARFRGIDPTTFLYGRGDSVLDRIKRLGRADRRYDAVPAAVAGKIEQLDDDQLERLKAWLDDILDETEP